MISINVNGKQYSVNADPETPLLWVLRDILGLTGTKYGCGVEICGACTVMVDNEAKKSCDFALKEAAGRKITTIEGLTADSSHPLQKAWIDIQVPQCGYCQSGMIMAAACRMKQNPRASGAEVVNEIQNVCVCGTYQRVRAAIQKAVGR